jgi:hypothetical protein
MKRVAADPGAQALAMMMSPPSWLRRPGQSDNSTAEYDIGDTCRWLRVVTLDDGQTVLNAFLDRRFRP